MEEEEPESDPKPSGQTSSGARRSSVGSSASFGNGTKALSSTNNPVCESPLTRIMAETVKFQAQHQPKRKSPDVVFSDNFMDTLSAVDSRSKKAKIVRKKPQPVGSNATFSGERAETQKVQQLRPKSPEVVFSNNFMESLSTTDSRQKKAKIMRKKLSSGGIAEPTERSESQKFPGNSRASFPSTDVENVSGVNSKKRVRFFDEIGKELVNVRFFEIEEGERVNVTKMGNMDKEAIKHLDSQHERQILLDARRHGFGAVQPPSGVTGAGYSSMLRDPLLMPPGYSRVFGSSLQPRNAGVSSSMAQSLEGRYPWRLRSVECQTVITLEYGGKSEAKLIEQERQRVILPALVLPTPLPISDLDPQELKRQREEGMMQMPKIIPLDLISEVISSNADLGHEGTEESGINLESLRMDMDQNNKEDHVEEKDEKMVTDELLDVLEDYDSENFGPRSPSPPTVHRIPSSDEDSGDIEITDDQKKSSVYVEREEVADGCEGIASPEPDQQQNDSIDSTSSSVKEIPIELRLPSESTQKCLDEDKEDLDIREHQAQRDLQQSSSLCSPLMVSSPTITFTSSGVAAASAISPENLQNLLKKKDLDLNSLLRKIDTIVGATQTSASSALTRSSISNVIGEAESSTAEKSFEKTDDVGSLQKPHQTPNVQPPNGLQQTALLSQKQDEEKEKLLSQQLQEQQISPGTFPPPPTHLYPNLRPPISGSSEVSFAPHSPFTRMPLRPLPAHIQQMLNNGPRGVAPGAVDGFPRLPRDFSIPPPPFGRFAVPPQATNFFSPPKQQMHQQNQQSSAEATPQQQLQTGEKAEYSTTKSPDETFQTASNEKKTKQSEVFHKEDEGQTSPGPPGLDKGGSPAPVLDRPPQQKLLTSSSASIPTGFSKPFSEQQRPPFIPNQPQQLSLEEAKNVAGICQFYRRTGTCNFGDRCKFAHDDEHLTLGVQLAMRGMNVAGRGGFPARGALTGRDGGDFRGGTHTDTGICASGNEKWQPRREGGPGSRGGRPDFDLSPIRGNSDVIAPGGGGSSGGTSHDRRYHRDVSPPRRRQGPATRARSRSRDRYNRRRRSRSRSRDKGRNRRRCARSSSKSSRSSSAGTYSRSPTPQRNRRRRSRSPRRWEHANRHRRRNYSKQRSSRRRSSSSSSSPRRRLRTRSSSSSSSSSPSSRGRQDNDKSKENNNKKGEAAGICTTGKSDGGEKGPTTSNSEKSIIELSN